MCDDQPCEAKWIKTKHVNGVWSAECPCGFRCEVVSPAERAPPLIHNVVQAHIGCLLPLPPVFTDMDQWLRHQGGMR